MIVKTFVLVLILSVLTSDVIGASYSNVYVASEVFPMEYYQYGTPYPSIASSRLSQINALPPVPSYVAPCGSPCVYPGQTIATPVNPNPNIVSYKPPIPSVPVLVTPTKEEATGYEYSYVVYDDNTGDHKAQREHSDGSVVRGEYSFIQPDGYVREVQYVADDVSGFNAVVKNFLPVAVEGNRKVEKEHEAKPPPCHEIQNESIKVGSGEESEEMSEKHHLKIHENHHKEQSKKHTKEDSEEESSMESKEKHKSKKESNESKEETNKSKEESVEEEDFKEKHLKKPKKHSTEDSGEQSEENSKENQHKKAKHSREKSGEASEEESKEKHHNKSKNESKEESGEESSDELKEKHHKKSKKGSKESKESEEESREESREESEEEPKEKHHKKSKKGSKESKESGEESGEKSGEESGEDLKEKHHKKSKKGSKESKESGEESGEESKVKFSHGKHKTTHELISSEQEAHVPYNDILRCIQAAIRRTHGVPSAMREEPSPLTYIILNKPC